MRRLSVPVMCVAVLGLLLSASAALAAPTPVGPGSMGAWSATRSNCAGNPESGSTTFVSGPGTPPAGGGSARFQIASDGDELRMLRTTAHEVDLDELTALSYWTYVAAGSPLAPYLILDVDQDDDGDSDDLLLFEPAYQHGYSAAIPDQGAVAAGTWQEWNALAGGWWSTSTPGVGPGTDVKTLAHYVTLFPEARIVNATSSGMGTLGGLRIAAGCGGGTWSSFDGNVDLLTVGTGVSTASYSFELDPIAPDTTITSGPDGTVAASDATFTFASNEPGATFECDLDLSGFAPCASPHTLTGLSDGSHTFRVRAIDGGLNVDPSPASRTWNVDTTAPAAPVIDTPVHGATVAGSPITIAGTAESDSVVRVMEGTTLLGTSTATGGAWSIQPALTQGSHTVTATATDVVGNISVASSPRSFSVDLPPSPPTITDPPEGAHLRSLSVTVRGLAQPGSIAKVYEGTAVRGTATTDASGVWTMSLGFAQGVRTIRATASDGGGESAATTRSFTIDVTAPAAPVIASPSEGSVHGPAVAVAGSGEAGSFLTLYDHGVVVGTVTIGPSGQWSIGKTFGGGEHVLTARVTDRAGNVGPSSAARAFVVDAERPRISSASASAGLYLPGEEAKVSGGATDDRGVVRIELTYYNALTNGLVGTQVATCSSCGATAKAVSWTATSNVPPPGQYRVQVVAIDVVGNRSDVATVSFIRL